MSRNSTPTRFSKDLAARILDRAASIDASEEKVDLATLRAAAFDAGISPEAFERALSEAAAPVYDRAAVPEQPRVPAFDIAAKALWVGALTGTVVVALAMAIFGPDEDALAGAVVGGSGALAGVFVHLLAKFRKRDH